MANSRATKLRKKLKVSIVVALIALLFGSAVLIWCVFGLPDALVEDLNKPSLSARIEKDEKYYIDECFFMADGRLGYSGGAYKTGIDVSDHQRSIDWEKVAADGIEFAVLRIGGRGYGADGNLYEDSRFEDNIKGAQAVGIDVGVYFFSQATTVEEAREEAQYTIALLEGYDIQLPVFFDWEHQENGRTADISSFPITDFTIVFCEEISRAGYQTGVYFNLNLSRYYLEMERLEEYNLWIADYNIPPVYGGRYECIQYDDAAAVDGIEGFVDLDLLMLPESSTRNYTHEQDEPTD